MNHKENRQLNHTQCTIKHADSYTRIDQYIINQGNIYQQDISTTRSEKSQNTRPANVGSNKDELYCRAGLCSDDSKDNITKFNRNQSPPLSLSH